MFAKQKDSCINDELNFETVTFSKSTKYMYVRKTLKIERDIPFSFTLCMLILCNTF